MYATGKSAVEKELNEKLFGKNMIIIDLSAKNCVKLIRNVEVLAY